MRPTFTGIALPSGDGIADRKQKCFLCGPFYGRACRRAMLGELKPKGPKGRDPKGSMAFLQNNFREQFPVSAYVGSSKNLKDLKDFPAQDPSGRVWQLINLFFPPSGWKLRTKNFQCFLRKGVSSGHGGRN